MSEFWRVEEQVTSDGFYITWPNTYTTRKDAELAILREAPYANARPSLYRVGRLGPVRVVEE